jgi:serine/threonine protein kinase
LNLFVQNLLPGGRKGEEVVLRYGFGSHVFALKMPAKQAIMMKLADFGTANTQVETNGQPVTIAQFTTLENTPPDFMILGDEATQGHGHDCWGLGLCMLHLFTGKAPYEEILEDVKCPANFKERLRKIWENERVGGYSVIRSVINEDVVKDDAGNILEGDPDEVFYHTLYRYLVLFGIPTEHFQQKKFPKVWKAIQDSFPTTGPARSKNGRPVQRKPGSDMTQYNRDRKKYSLQNGSNKSIARARNALRSMEGGMDLLFHLCAFDPTKRATAMQVLNSPFMENLREEGAAQYGANATVHSYMDFATHT